MAEENKEQVVEQPTATETVATEPEVKEEVATEPVAEPAKEDLESNKTPKEGSDAVEKPSEPEVVKDDDKFEFPEGVKVNDEKVKSFIAIAKELKLTKEQAQKLVDMDTKNIVEADKAFTAMKEGWKQDTLKELGENAEQKLGEASLAFKQFGDDEFVKLMKDTGLENHPAVVRVFRNIGSKIATDKTVSATSNGVKSSKTMQEILYGEE